MDADITWTQTPPLHNIKNSITETENAIKLLDKDGQNTI
jgi:hypothetical protein